MHPPQAMLFASDIDGTLLDSNRWLSPRTIAAIQDVQGFGHHVVLCSSRMPSSMALLQEAYGDAYGDTSPWTIAYNGALVLDPDGEALIDVGMSPDACAAIYEVGSRARLHMSFFGGSSWFSTGADQWEQREIDNTRVRPSPVSAAEYRASTELSETAIHKVMVMGEPAELDTLTRVLADPGLAVTTYRSKDTYLEIASALTSKGKALQLVASKLDVGPANVVYFGDGYNDVSALQVAGIGVAMDNAVRAAKDAADELTTSHLDDGVARVIERWVC